MKPSAKFIWGTFAVGFVVTMVYVTKQEQVWRQIVVTTSDSSESNNQTWIQQPYVRRQLNMHWLRYLLYPPFPCGAGESHLLGTFVSSAVGNFAQRSAIRETWGKPLMNIRHQQNNQSTGTFLFFVLGRTDNPVLQEALAQEAANYSDIIQEDFQDTYLNLTLKSVLILRWVTTFCPRIRFVFKTDDDMFINAVELLDHLASRKPQQEVLLGRLIHGATPIHKNSSKWFAPPISFDSKVYPNYLSGTGYVLSGDVADRLYAQVDRVPLFHLEDIYITGLLAAEAGIKPTNHGGFKWYMKDVKPCNYKKHVTYHQVPPNDIRSMWADINNKTLTCS